VSAIHDSPPYFWDQWGWPLTEPLTVTHARAHWWTSDLANAFVSPGVNSRGELVPSHGASRRRLGDKIPEFKKSKIIVAFENSYRRSLFQLSCRQKVESFLYDKLLGHLTSFICSRSILYTSNFSTFFYDIFANLYMGSKENLERAFACSWAAIYSTTECYFADLKSLSFALYVKRQTPGKEKLYGNRQ
jgi:hypothetical protein